MHRIETPIAAAAQACRLHHRYYALAKAMLHAAAIAHGPFSPQYDQAVKAATNCRMDYEAALEHWNSLMKAEKPPGEGATILQFPAKGSI